MGFIDGGIVCGIVGIALGIAGIALELAGIARGISLSAVLVLGLADAVLARGISLNAVLARWLVVGAAIACGFVVGAATTLVFSTNAVFTRACFLLVYFLAHVISPHVTAPSRKEGIPAANDFASICFLPSGFSSNTSNTPLSHAKNKRFFIKHA